MKKYLLPLILILFLIFTLIGNCTWLSGYDQRIKLTVDNTKIDSALSWFPVTVILSSTHGDCVFDELQSNANRKKIAFTKADGTTQLYGEIEKWDDGNEKAIIHVSRDGWAISNTVDTDFYMYFDIDHADNDTYIGDIDSTPSGNVWDSNFKAVCHMVDETTSTLKDSTSNNYDFTKEAANRPLEVDGELQEFSGVTNESYITQSTLLDTVPANGTISFFLKPDVATPTGISYVFAKHNTAPSNDFIGIRHETTGKILILYTANSGTTIYIHSLNALGNTNYKLVTLTWGSDGLKLYINDNLDGSDPSTSAISNGTNTDLHISSYTVRNYNWDGRMKEFRVDSIQRNAAWMKATYNTLWDTLLTYGSEETEEEEVNAIFFGMNF